MIKISVFGRKLKNIELEPLISGNNGTFDVMFDFTGDKSEIWKNAELSAVFRIITNIGAAQTIAPVPLDVNNRCAIPLSVLKEPCYKVYLCLYGNFRDGRTVVSESVQIGKTVFGISDSEFNAVCEDELQKSLYDLLLGKINEIKMSILQPFEIGDGLKLENNILSVDTADRVEEDNTKPVSSAAVYMEMGNIEALLSKL